MTKTPLPTNFLKHTSKNPIQKLLIANFYKSFIGLAKSVNSTSILDAGCGEGFTLQRLMQEGMGEKIEGIEYSKEAISFGKKLFPHLTINHGSVYDLPYKDNSFDLIICTEVLEHLEEPAKALGEMLRVSGKYLIISVPNEPLFMLSNFLRGKNVMHFGNDPEHIQHWTIFSFQRFLRRENIKIKAMKLPFPWIMALIEK